MPASLRGLQNLRMVMSILFGHLDVLHGLIEGKTAMTVDSVPVATADHHYHCATEAGDELECPALLGNDCLAVTCFIVFQLTLVDVMSS